MGLSEEQTAESLCKGPEAGKVSGNWRDASVDGELW